MMTCYQQTCKCKFYPIDHKCSRENLYSPYNDLFNHLKQYEIICMINELKKVA